MADPYPKPKPDKIEPQSPPERPTPPMTKEDPAGQPPEVPGHPGGGDTDEPCRGPDELPPQQVEGSHLALPSPRTLPAVALRNAGQRDPGSRPGARKSAGRRRRGAVGERTG